MVRVGLLVGALVACGGGKVVVEQPPAQPMVDQPTAQERAARRQARQRNTCDRFAGIAQGAVHGRAFEAAASAVLELRKHRCGAARIGAIETDLALAVHRHLTTRATPADISWVTTEWTGCMPRAGTPGPCAAHLLRLCPKPKQPGTYSKRIAAYTRVILQLTATAELPVWIAAQVCLSHSLGVTHASAMVEQQANIWRDKHQRVSLTTCLAQCRLSPAVHTRLTELDKSFPQVVVPVEKPSTTLDALSAELRYANARARQLVRARRLDRAAGVTVLSRGDAAATRGHKLFRRRKELDAISRRRFSQAVREWGRRGRDLRYKLRKR